jgi:hypothetical protein
LENTLRKPCSGFEVDGANEEIGEGFQNLCSSHDIPNKRRWIALLLVLLPELLFLVLQRYRIMLTRPSNHSGFIWWKATVGIGEREEVRQQPELVQSHGNPN